MCKEIIYRTLWALKYPSQRIAFIGFQVWACVLSGGISLCYSVIFCSLMVLSFIFGWVFRICPMSLCLQKDNWDYYIVFYLHLRLSYHCPTKLEGVYWIHLVRPTVRPSVCLLTTWFPEHKSSLLWNFNFKFHMHIRGGHRQKLIDFQRLHFQNGRLAAILDFFVSIL